MAALGTPDRELPALLERLCGEDRRLRGEAERVIRACGRAESSLSFLEEPLGTFAGPLLGAEGGDLEEEIDAGTVIGPYVVERPLGRGGMGVVYLARDPILDRPAALKLLPSWLSFDTTAKRKLAREARAVCALDHPNIGVIYGFGEMPDGRPYLAMAYHEGRTLRDRLEDGPLDSATCVELAAQMAAAVSAAHDRNIVHRDLKPSNVVVTPSGSAKVLDFGAARLVAETPVTAGELLGTVAYMSPEQTRGEAVDKRSDVWSLGVVLYEILTGARPFPGNDERSLVRAIREDEPEPLRKLRPGIDPSLARVVEICLQKDPVERYPDAGALHRALLDLGENAPASPPGRPTASRTVLVAAAGALALAVLAVLPRPRSEAANGALSGSTIAVLPFQVNGSEAEEWGEGLVTLLSTGLDGAGGLRAIDSRTVLAQWYEEPRPRNSLESALGIARRTGAQYALTGAAISLGPALRLTADLYRVDEAEQIAQVRAEGSADEVLDLVDRLAIEALRALSRDRGSPQAPRVELAGLTTSSLPALKAFLEGDRENRQSDFEAAIAAYERAVAADSTFALAHYQMIDTYGWLGRAREMEVALSSAGRFQDRLPARERLLTEAVLEAHEKSTGASLEKTIQAARRYPDSAEAWYRLGEAYLHNPQTLGTLEMAEGAFERAVALEPGFSPYRIHLVDLAFQLHADSARAATELNRYLARTAEGDTYRRVFEIGFGLAFGAPESRTEAVRALDSAPVDLLPTLLESVLTHPRFHKARRAVLKAWVARRGDLPLPSWASRHLAASLFKRGRMGVYLADLDTDIVASGSEACDLYLAYGMGIPIPRERLDAILAISHADSIVRSNSWCRAMYAAEHGQWTDHAGVVTRFRTRAAKLIGEAPDRARALDGAAEALDAYAAVLRGDSENGLRRLRAVQQYPPFSRATRDNLLFRIGLLLIERGQPEAAAPYFRSLRWNPVATYHQGRAYEESGSLEEARAAYRSFAFDWVDADPALQPLVQRARNAVERLGGAGPR